jgi:hypothetical protein
MLKSKKKKEKTNATTLSLRLEVHSANNSERFLLVILAGRSQNA